MRGTGGETRPRFASIASPPPPFLVQCTFRGLLRPEEANTRNNQSVWVCVGRQMGWTKASTLGFLHGHVTAGLGWSTRGAPPRVTHTHIWRASCELALCRASSQHGMFQQLHSFNPLSCERGPFSGFPFVVRISPELCSSGPETCCFFDRRARGGRSGVKIHMVRGKTIRFSKLRDFLETRRFGNAVFPDNM